MEGDEGECRSVLDHSFTSSVLEEASRSRRVDEVEVEAGGWTRSKTLDHDDGGDDDHDVDVDGDHDVDDPGPRPRRRGRDLIWRR